MIKDKIFILFDNKMIINGLQEPDSPHIKTRSGTYMFGINNEKVEFSDIYMNYILPSKGESGQANTAGGQSGPAISSDMKVDDEEEMFEEG